MNIAEQPNSPLFIYLPSAPSTNSQPAPIPRFLQGKPVASINYRWNSFDQEEANSSSVDDVWPTPVHDTFFAYQWLVENLSPEGLKRRDIYVYGSHLGASLATSLALTESQPHKPFAVRGLVSYNGIYNWTMFFPDHPVNHPGKYARKISDYNRLVRRLCEPKPLLSQPWSKSPFVLPPVGRRVYRHRTPDQSTR